MKYTLALLLLLSHLFCLGQKDTSKTVNDSLKLVQTFTAERPQVIPPSSEAAALGKYGEVPVSYYTGLVNNTIPLYTVQNRDLSLPISLSYHHSGIRVAEDASWVGLGWSLNGGGVITRSVRGFDDFHEPCGYAFHIVPQNLPDDFFQTVNYNNPNFKTFFEYDAQCTTTGMGDNEPDIFYYNVGGKSGKFILEALERSSFPVGGIKGIALDKSDVKITVFKVSSGVYRWELILEDGTVYEFTEQEKTATLFSSATNNSSPQNLNVSTLNLTYNSNRDIRQITAWYLTKIKSAQSDAELTLEYYTDKKYVSTSRLNAREYRVEKENDVSGCSNSLEDTTPNNIAYSVNISKNIYLKKIHFENGYVEFVTEQREDIQPFIPSSGLPFCNFAGFEIVENNPSFSSLPQGYPQRLASINIYQSDNTLYKKWAFNYGYYNSSYLSAGQSFNEQLDKYDNVRLRLEKLQETDKNGATLPAHTFDYYGDTYDTNGLLIAPTFPKKTTWSQDYFGYYNGATTNDNSSNLHIIPDLDAPKMLAQPVTKSFTVIGVQHITGINREVDESSVKLGALRKVTNPLKGSTEFLYESNYVLGRDSDFETESYSVSATSNPSSDTKSFFLSNTNDSFFETKLQATCQAFNTGSSSTPCNSSSYYTTADLNSTAFSLVNQSNPNSPVVNITYQQLLSSRSCTVSNSLETCTYNYLSQSVIVPGNYTLTVNAKYYKLIGSTKIFKFRPNDIKTTKVGGLRIAKMIDKDNLGNSYEKTFDYTLSNGFTSGVQTTRLKKYSYGFLEKLNVLIAAGQVSNSSCESGRWVVILKSQNIYPIGNSASGSSVGYSRVTVKQRHASSGTTIGKSVYQYINFEDSSYPTDFFADVPAIAYLGNGMLQKEEHYRENGNLLKEVFYNPVKGKSSFYKGLSYKAGQIPSGGSGEYHITKQYYKIPSEHWYNASTKTLSYSLTDPSKYTESYQATEYAHATYNQPTRMIETVFNASANTSIAEGYTKFYETRLQYPYNYSDGVSNAMVQKNMVAIPIEKKINLVNYQSGSQVIKHLYTEKKDFGLVGATYLPTAVHTTYQNGSPRTQFTMAYQSNGNLSTLTDRSGQQTQASYFGSGDIGKNNLVKEVSQGVFPQTLVSKYDYRPLVGVSKITQPNDLQQFNEFDDFGRLILRKDHQSAITERLSYHYPSTSGSGGGGCSVSAPTLSVSSGLCSSTISALGCSGTITWSNGSSGASINVLTNQSATYTATCTEGSCTSSASSAVSVPVLPSGWTSQTIGSPPTAACVQESSGIWTINGTGNTFDASDNIGFVSQSLSGNAVMVAKLNSMSANAQGMRSGIMLRASNSSTADYFQFFYDSGFGVISVFEQSSTAGGDSPHGTINSSIPIWLRLKKDGTSITMWYSQSANPAWNNDADWTQYGAGFTSSAFNSGFLMGLAVYNNAYGGNGLTNQTQFSNVSTYNF